MEGIGRRTERAGAIAGAPATARMHFTIDSHQQPDGRWAAQVPEFPQIIAFAATRQEAIAKAELRALIVLAEKRFRALRSG